MSIAQKHQSIFVRRFLCMLQHGVFAVIWCESTDVDLTRLQSFKKIVILTAPSMVHVRHTVNAYIIATLNGNSATKQSSIRQMKAKFVQCRAHMTRLLRAGIQMAQTHRHQINIVQYQTGIVEAVPVHGSNVEQFGSIEWFRVELFDYKYSVVDVLLSQVVVHVDQKCLQLLFALAIRHNYCRAE